MSIQDDFREVEDFNKVIEKLEILQKPIHSNFQAISIDYINKISQKLGDNPITRMRTDFLFKLESTLYLFKLLYKDEKTTVAKVNMLLKKDPRRDLSILANLVSNQKTLFDSILYNLSSVYDYYANMLGYIYKGKSLKWNGLVKDARNKSSKSIGMAHKSLLIESHIDFVDSLFSHRSYLIHENMSHPPYKITHLLDTDCYKVIIFTPKKFINEFKSLKKEIGRKEVSLKAALEWILTYGFQNINELLFGMKDEFEDLRKIEKGNEVITFLMDKGEDVTNLFWRKK